ncbi:MAG: cadmium-translocating P-type ATPase [Desulfobacteraceae bacterium]|nr:MAG: cadmium-translocating P-type ATPase [Desulfobacteraceae bacterium]
MVFAMLMEAADAPDPSRFKETDLFRRCVAAGVVPGPAEAAGGQAASTPAERVPEAAFAQSEGREIHSLPLDCVVQGMWCPACAWVIGAALERLDGVHAVQCDFSTDRLRCHYDPVSITPDRIRQAVGRLGYTVTAPDQAGATLRGDFIRLAVSALLSVNVMMLSWALYSGFFMTLTAEGISYISWPIMLMASAVMLYGGAPVARKAWAGLRHGVPGMEALIVLGAGGAYLYSLVNWWAGSLHLYFDTASMLVTLLLLGKLLEAQAKNRVRRDLEGFLSLRPTKVKLCGGNFPMGRYVSVEQLAPGDVFRIGSGEVLPADGRVIQGSGRLDVSAITGEPHPAAVKEGDAAVSGSRVVEGDLWVRAEQVGTDALLGEMIAVVQQSLAQKTPLESRTDRLLAIFVPAIAAMAAVTGLVGFAAGLTPDQALVRAVTVLVIACPCALGIAIPLARVAGVAGAGRRGILIRDFQAFEQATRFDTVVFDKTGTVTHGAWTVESIVVRGGRSEADILALALGLEKQADHTVARALRAYGERRAVTPAAIEDVQIHAEGVSGRLDGRTLRIGRRGFAVGEKAATGKAPHKQNLSEVVLGVDGAEWAVFYFGDQVREGMVKAMQRLQGRGLAVQLISGDEEAATRTVAAALGIREAAGQLLPQDKAERIRALQSRGHRVAMVGDGVNDAPALAQADLAVAVHSGSGLARHTAGVTLMRDPAQLLDLTDWAARVNRTVHQNLWCAFGYNVISIPVAMAGLLSPLLAAGAMLLSSLSVIGNTLLLGRNKMNAQPAMRNVE